MATCLYCQQRKGKRSCPALGGAICSQCCGQHRLQEILCPSDCVYLGGLAILGDPVAAAAAFTAADYDAGVQKLLAYPQGVSMFRDEALLRCFDPPETPPQWAADVATGYLFYGHRDASGRRLIDHFLALRGRGLSPGEVAALMALQNAWASLFEVVAVQAGSGLELRDLLSGETVRVKDVSASGQLKKWDVMFTWLMTAGDHVELTGASCLVPRQHLDRVRGALDTELANARVARPGVPDRVRVGSLAWAVIRELLAAHRDQQPPTLHTTDGEPLVSCKARYAIEDEAAVRAALAGIPGLATDDAGYRWSRDAATGVGSVTLGTVRVSGGELMLETMSRERQERGKRLLEDALGALISHREDSAESFEAAIGDWRSQIAGGGDPDGVAGGAGVLPRGIDQGKRSVHAPDHVPDDRERALVGEYLQGHYRQWLDAPLPALDGKTPRDAARTDRGRDQVETLLKDIENTTLALPGGEAVDFSALRRELGLESADEASGTLTYDAEQAPDATAWLALDDSLKAQAVGEHHHALGADVDMPNARMHAMMHVIVENQLAGSELPEVRATLERLSHAGVSRHDAIHAIGTVVAGALWKVLKDKTVFDREAAARALAAL